MRRTTARSLVLDLLSSLRGDSMPVGGLVAAGRLLDIAENSVRVAVARLLAGGQIERDERGLYRLGAAAAAVDRRIRSWRQLDEQTRRWNGDWVGVHAGPDRLSRAERRSRERALRWLGFESLAPGLAVRPDNLRTGTRELAAELRHLGLEPDALVFRLGQLETSADARARRLWDVDGLAARYAASLSELARSEARLPGLAADEAMVESFLLGGRVIRELVLDPLLPSAILPTDGRRALVSALRRYDRAGRRCWARFMERFGAPHASAPVDTQQEPGLAGLALQA